MNVDEAVRDLQFAEMDAEKLRDDASSLLDKLEEIRDGLREAPNACDQVENLANAFIGLFRQASVAGSVTADQIKAAGVAADILEQCFDPDADDDDQAATAQPQHSDA
jgi:hypothetical protein